MAQTERTKGASQEFYNYPSEIENYDREHQQEERFLNRIRMVWGASQ